MRSRGRPRSHTPLSGGRDNEQLTIFCRRKGNASSRTPVTNGRASFTRRGFILGVWRADGVSDTWKGKLRPEGVVQIGRRRPQRVCVTRRLRMAASFPAWGPSSHFSPLSSLSCSVFSPSCLLLSLSQTLSSSTLFLRESPSASVALFLSLIKFSGIFKEGEITAGSGGQWKASWRRWILRVIGRGLPWWPSG